jgi:hypothetical protein
MAFLIAPGWGAGLFETKLSPTLGGFSVTSSLTARPPLSSSLVSSVSPPTR